MFDSIVNDEVRYPRFLSSDSIAIMRRVSFLPPRPSNHLMLITTELLMGNSCPPGQMGGGFRCEEGSDVRIVQM